MPAEVVRAGSGRQHVLHLLQRAMAAAGQVPAAGTVPVAGRPPISDLAALLEQAFRTARGRSLVLVLSDFLEAGPLDASSQEGQSSQAGQAGQAGKPGDAWHKAFAPLARRHEVVGVWLRDPREVELPPAGIVTFQDAETGEQVVVDTSQPTLRAAFARLARKRAAAVERLFALNGAALWMLSTAEPFVPALVTFLEQRRRTLVGARRLLGTAS